MKILDRYNSILEELYNYFGYTEGWKVYPIDDSREYFWIIKRDCVEFYDTKEDYLNGNEDSMYENEIINKSIFIGADYTAIIVDTHTDGNKFLQIFDNAKKLDT